MHLLKRFVPRFSTVKKEHTFTAGLIAVYLVVTDRREGPFYSVARLLPV